MNLGAPELIIVLVVILVLFGGQKLPGLARSIGQAQNEFRKGLTDTDDDLDAVQAGSEGDGIDDVREDPAPDTVTMTKAELDDLLGRGRERADADGDDATGPAT